MGHFKSSDIHLLRVFEEVVDAGGLAAAQHRLNVAPSTISTQIAALEQRLGFKVCKRGRAGFSLTPKGKIVLEKARLLITNLDLFKLEMGSILDSDVGFTRIGLLDSIAHNPNLRLSSAINTFKKINSRHQFEIDFFTPTEFEGAILNKSIDLAIGWTGYESQSLEYTPLFKEVQNIYCERRHPLFDQTESIDSSILQNQDWVQLNYALPAGMPFARSQVSTATASHMEGVAHLVLSGMLIGYLPDHYAQQWAAEDRLRPLLPKEMFYEIQLSLITKKLRHQDLQLKPFATTLLKLHKNL